MHKIWDKALPIPIVKNFTLVRTTYLVVFKCDTQACLSVCQIHFFIFSVSWYLWTNNILAKLKDCFLKWSLVLWSLHKRIYPVVLSWSNKNSVSIILAFSPSNLVSGASFHLLLIYSWWMDLFSTYIWQKCIVLSKLPGSRFPHEQKHFH